MQNYCDEMALLSFVRKIEVWPTDKYSIPIMAGTCRDVQLSVRLQLPTNHIVNLLNDGTLS